jgi:crossover junction endodeoxyribonuclease RuvC
MKILGIDPGTGIVGFGVIQIAKKPTLVDAGVIRTHKDQSAAQRLSEIYTELSGIIAQNKPDAASVEKLFFAQNVTTAMTVSQARGVILLALEQANVPIFEYTPLQIKMATVGYGRATKAQIQEMVRVQLRLSEIPKPDDCADALAAALTHSATILS